MLTTSRFSEVCNRAKLAGKRLSSVEPSVQFQQCVSCMIFIIEFDVNISQHVFADILANLYVFNLPKILKLFEDFGVEFIKLKI